MPNCDCESRARHLADLLNSKGSPRPGGLLDALFVDPEAAYLTPWCDAIQGSHMRIIFEPAGRTWVVEPIQ